MNDAIEGERASLIFRDEKSIRARRRFNCVKTNVERIEVCALLRRRECFYECEVDYVRCLVKRRTMSAARRGAGRSPNFANCITLILAAAVLKTSRDSVYQYDEFPNCRHGRKREREREKESDGAL